MAWGSVLVLLALLVACGLAMPPLRVHRVFQGVVLDVKTLGEYATSISHLRLREDNGKVVWDLKAGAPAPQIFEIHLQCGSNSVRIPEYDEYKVLVPASSDKFLLHGGKRYIAEVWGVDKLMRAQSSFTINDCPSK